MDDSEREASGIEVVPDNWCRYLSIDPGVHICAVLFLAIPPDNSHCYVYREIYQRRSDPEKLALAVAEAMRVDDPDEEQIERFIIDPSAAQTTPVTRNINVELLYAQAFREAGIKTVHGTARFEYSVVHHDPRRYAVKNWLKLRDGGLPYLRIHPCCTNLISELPKKRFRRDQSTGLLNFKETLRTEDHATDALEYAAALNLRYVAPPPRMSYYETYLDQERRRRRRQEQRTKFYCGPASAAPSTEKQSWTNF